MKHRYHLNVVFQFTLGYYFFEVIEMEKHVKKIVTVLCTIGAFFVLPLLIGIGMSFINCGPGSNDGWLGFWGGYAGSAISILFAYFNTKNQISEERSRQQEAIKVGLLPHFKISFPSYNGLDSIDPIKARWSLTLNYETLTNSRIEIENVLVTFDIKLLKVNQKKQFDSMSRSIGKITFSSNVDVPSTFLSKGQSVSNVIGDCSKNIIINIFGNTAEGTYFFSTRGGLLGVTSFYFDNNQQWALYFGNNGTESAARDRLNDFLKSNKIFVPEFLVHQ